MLIRHADVMILHKFRPHKSDYRDKRNMKSAILTLLLACLIASASACRNTSASVGNSAPAFLRPGRTYEAALVGVFTVLEIGQNGWIRVRDRSGKPAWMNTNATQVIWERR